MEGYFPFGLSCLNPDQNITPAFNKAVQSGCHLHIILCSSWLSLKSHPDLLLEAKEDREVSFKMEMFLPGMSASSIRRATRQLCEAIKLQSQQVPVHLHLHPGERRSDEATFMLRLPASVLNWLVELRLYCDAAETLEILSLLSQPQPRKRSGTVTSRRWSCPQLLKYDTRKWKHVIVLLDGRYGAETASDGRAARPAPLRILTFVKHHPSPNAVARMAGLVGAVNLVKGVAGQSQEASRFETASLYASIPTHQALTEAMKLLEEVSFRTKAIMTHFLALILISE